MASTRFNMPTSAPFIGRINQHTLPNSIYMTFNAPAVNDYHRGILVTNTFKLGRDPPSGKLFHAVDDENAKSWHFESRDVKNIDTSKSLTLLYRIGQLVGTSEKVAAQAEQIEETLRQVKFDASADRIARLGKRVTDGYSCILWTEDALTALVKLLPSRTFLPLLSFSSETGIITPEGIVAEARLARRLAGPAEAELMVPKHVPGEFEVYN